MKPKKSRGLSPGYRRYMQSGRWRQRCRKVRERSGGICERCRRRPGAHVHHLTYARFGCEDLADLEHVCLTCHRKAHPARKIGRAPTQQQQRPRPPQPKHWGKQEKAARRALAAKEREIRLGWRNT